MTRKPKEEILIGERDFDTVFSYDAGAVRSKFLIELRDNRRITGTKCPACNLVYVPARSSCNKCFSALNDFVEVADQGTLITYTVVNDAQPFYPSNPPFIFGIIKLDGADTGLVHLIGEIEPAEIKIGMRVKAVFNEKRTGNIKDIKYFKSAGGE